MRAEFALKLMRRATGWYAVPGYHRFAEIGENDRSEGEGHDAAQRAAIKEQVNQFTLPPDAVLIRRMHGVVAAVLHNLRAGADWGAIAAEYLHAEPPATGLGRAEVAFFARRGG